MQLPKIQEFNCIVTPEKRDYVNDEGVTQKVQVLKDITEGNLIVHFPGNNSPELAVNSIINVTAEYRIPEVTGWHNDKTGEEGIHKGTEGWVTRNLGGDFLALVKAQKEVAELENIRRQGELIDAKATQLAM